MPKAASIPMWDTEQCTRKQRHILGFKTQLKPQYFE